MKQLLLMRHAKSDWSTSATSDFNRPLNTRGQRDIQHMAALLKACALVPQCVLASPAVRAEQSATSIGAALNITPVFNPDLYLAPLEILIQVLENQSATLESIMLIGHNPGMAELLQQLGGCSSHLPTAGLALINFATDQWANISDFGGELQWFVNPRLIQAIAANRDH